MAEKKSFAEKQNDEETRRKNAGQRLANDLAKNHIMPISRWSDDLHEKTFFTLVAMFIVEKLEILLGSAKQVLDAGNLVHVDCPIVIMNETEINVINDKLTEILGENRNIIAQRLNFDQFMADGLARLADLGYIPQVEYMVTEDGPVECKIILQNLTEFTPPKV